MIVTVGEVLETDSGLVPSVVTGWAWFGLEVMPAYLLLITLNVSYSLVFRNVLVLDVIFNSATHPPRFWLEKLKKRSRPPAEK